MLRAYTFVYSINETQPVITSRNQHAREFPFAQEPAMDIRRYMTDVPDSDRFLSVDEMHAGLDRLAEEYPDITRLRRVGTSKLGEPIRMLSVGTGSQNALLFGCPHPNEPIGGMLIHHLSEPVCADAELRDAFDYTWHFIPTVDPDGTRLNEGWFGGPFTPTNYARHFYRPAGFEQVEWTFPISYKKLYFDKTLPETEMLMRVIDELKPELMASLAQRRVQRGLLLRLRGRSKALRYCCIRSLPGRICRCNWARRKCPGPNRWRRRSSRCWKARPPTTISRRTAAIRPPIIRGTSSFEYSRPYGTYSIVTEVAYFDDPRINDETPTEVNRREANLARLDLSLESKAIMSGFVDAVDADLRAKTPFETTVRWWLDLSERQEAERAWIESNPDMDRPATEAELFSNRVMPQFFRLCWQGLIVRMLEAEVAIGNGTPAVRATLQDATETFERWGAQLESELNFRTVPIRKLVAVQLGAILAAAEYLAGKRAVAGTND